MPARAGSAGRPRPARRETRCRHPSRSSAAQREPLSMFARWPRTQPARSSRTKRPSDSSFRDRMPRRRRSRPQERSILRSRIPSKHHRKPEHLRRSNHLFQTGSFLPGRPRGLPLDATARGFRPHPNPPSLKMRRISERAERLPEQILRMISKWQPTRFAMRAGQCQRKGGKIHSAVRGCNRLELCDEWRDVRSGAIQIAANRT